MKNNNLKINITKFLKNNIDQIHQDIFDCFTVVDRNKLSRTLYKIELLKQLIDWIDKEEYERSVYETN